MDKELEKILLELICLREAGSDKRKSLDETISQIKSLFKREAKECEPYISEYRKGDGEKENLFKMGFSRCNKEWNQNLNQKFK